MITEKKIKQIRERADSGQKFFNPLYIVILADLALIGLKFLKLNEKKTNGSSH